MLLAPCIGYWILVDQPVTAAVACAAAGLTDVLDGWIARTYPAQQSTLGTYLDPLADKILINTVATALGIVGTLPVPLVALWWAKDVLLIGGTYRRIRAVRPQAQRLWHVLDPLRIPLSIEPTLLSKVNTAGQFVTLAVALVDPTNATVLPGLEMGTAVTTVLAVASYASINAFRPTGRRSK